MHGPDNRRRTPSFLILELTLATWFRLPASWCSTP